MNELENIDWQDDPASLRKVIKVKSARGGKATVGETLAELRRNKAHRGVVSGDFLSFSHMARECSCGGCAIMEDGYICPRCGVRV